MTAGDILDYAYTGAAQTVVLPPGRYRLECWGAQGGYRLGRPPEEISVGDILRALEGDLDPVTGETITGNRIDRVENCKSVDDYIARIDEMIERKKAGFIWD